jgi:hypothetical protein
MKYWMFRPDRPSSAVLTLSPICSFGDIFGTQRRETPVPDRQLGGSISAHTPSQMHQEQAQSSAGASATWQISDAATRLSGESEGAAGIGVVLGQDTKGGFVEKLHPGGGAAMVLIPERHTSKCPRNFLFCLCRETVFSLTSRFLKC